MSDGVSPSGKASAFGADIRGFESLYPIHFDLSLKIFIQAIISLQNESKRFIYFPVAG